jgi:hypothetical protein
MEAFCVAIYNPIKTPFTVTFHYGGTTRYQLKRGDTTITTADFYGMGTVIDAYKLPNVTIQGPNDLLAACGGTFSSKLLQRFDIVSKIVQAGQKKNAKKG